MTARPGPPERILVVADTRPQQVALETALALADAHGAALEAIACVEPPRDLATIARLSNEEPERMIADAVARTRAEVGARLAEIVPDRPVKLSVLVGKAYLEIIRHVGRTGCDLVIKKAEPLSGMDRFLFSSTDQQLLRKCPCPVWLQTATAPPRPHRVLAAVDLDTWDADQPDTLRDLNRRVIDAACAIATGSQAEVVVLHAWDAVGEGLIWAFGGGSHPRLSSQRYVNEVFDARQKAMTQFLAEVQDEIGPGQRLVPLLAQGTPEQVIQDQSRAVAADVVVMGTVARTGLSGVVIGNTAENILNSIDCPVLAVKPDGFVSPLPRM
jgi:nucleotide-binding universal stress UspA family protein